MCRLRCLLFLQNVLWLVTNADPHRALSFDRLHFNNSGLGGHHLWTAFKDHVDKFGRESQKLIELQYACDLSPQRPSSNLCSRVDAIPRWRGLNHFSNVITVSYTDGSKHEDISKVCTCRSHLLLCSVRFSDSFLDYRVRIA
jgi:hypothetical protein